MGQAALLALMASMILSSPVRRVILAHSSAVSAMACAAVPPVVLGVLIQKHLVRGLTFGALKQ